jgi:hypothetical protein
VPEEHQGGLHITTERRLPEGEIQGSGRLTT